MGNTIEIGKIYIMSNRKVRCVGFTKRGHAKMQTFGMTYGYWPGNGDISDYNYTTKAFTEEWAGVINKFKLPTKKQAKKNELIINALATAAHNYNWFGACYSDAWLGTAYSSYGAWYVYADSGVDYSNSQDNLFVIAPSFNLDISKIIVEGIEIKKTKSDKIELGKSYKISDVDTICVGFTEKGYAKMQTSGMTAGAWPGEIDVSNYDDVTRKFTSEWKETITNFKLPTRKQAEKNELIRNALKGAANNYSFFGADYGNAWLGIIGDSKFAWRINSRGSISSNGVVQSSSYVIAPAFNLDLSRIILDGDEIKQIKRKSAEGNTKDNLLKFTMLDMSTLHLSQDTIDKLLYWDNDNIVVYPKNENDGVNRGAFIHVRSDISIVTKHEVLDMPEDLLRVLLFAADNSCDWINLGYDGKIISSLPVYSDRESLGYL